MSAHLAAACELLSSHPLVDGHNDLPWNIRTRFGPDLGRLDLAAPVAGTHTDLPRLRRGGVGGQFWSVYVPGPLRGDGDGGHHAGTSGPRPPDGSRPPGRPGTRAECRG